MKVFILIILFLLSVTNIGNSKTILGQAKIIDGDTIHIKSNKIRLHGIDAPELNQTCLFENKSWDCGKESESFLLELINLKKMVG